MTYANAINALADPRRREIVAVLRAGPRSVADLARHFPVSRPAVSQHLRVLHEAGLVQVTERGTRRIYGLAPDGLSDLRRYLDELWTDALSAFARAAELEAQRMDDNDGRD